MTRSCFFKKGILLLSVLILSGCASTRDRFPKYGDSVKQYSTIPAVVDLFIYSDIAGQSRGFNPEANNDYLEEALAQVDNTLTERGFSMGEVVTTLGLTHEKKLDTNYVISKNWKSTGVEYEQPLNSYDNNPWYSSQTRELVLSIFDIAELINQSKGHDQAYAQKKIAEDALTANQELPQAISEIELPAHLFKGLGSEIVLLVRINGRSQKFSKYLTKGILVGAASGILTSGVTAVVPRGSYAYAEVVVFNTKTRQILWGNTGYAEGRGSVRLSIKSAMQHHPYSDGETQLEKKIKRDRRARGL